MAKIAIKYEKLTLFGRFFKSYVSVTIWLFVGN